jgi:hypothetical protein
VEGFDSAVRSDWRSGVVFNSTPIIVNEPSGRLPNLFFCVCLLWVVSSLWSLLELLQPCYYGVHLIVTFAIYISNSFFCTSILARYNRGTNKPPSGTTKSHAGIRGNYRPSVSVIHPTDGWKYERACHCSVAFSVRCGTRAAAPDLWLCDSGKSSSLTLVMGFRRFPKMTMTSQVNQPPLPPFFKLFYLWFV